MMTPKTSKNVSKLCKKLEKRSKKLKENPRNERQNQREAGRFTKKKSIKGLSKTSID